MAQEPFTVAEKAARRLFGILDHQRGPLRPDEFPSVILALVFLEWASNPRLNGERYQVELDTRREGGRSLGDVWTSAVRIFEHRHPEWDSVIPLSFGRLDDDTLQTLYAEIALALEETSPADLFDAVLDFAAAREGLRGGEFASPISVRILLLELARPDGGAVFDPAAGVGGLLTTAATFASQNGASVGLLGQEISVGTWAIAKMRLALHGYEGDLRKGDSLLDDAFEGVRVEHVLTVPPFNQKLGVDWRALMADRGGDPRWRYGVPPASEASLAWVEHALAHLAPGGRAFVVLAPSAGVRRPGAAIRRELVESGALEAVIALPPALFTSTNIPAVIWVLRNEGEFIGSPHQPDDVLFINASQLGVAQHRGPVDLTGKDVVLVADTYRLWRDREKITGRSRLIAAAVPRERLSATEDVSFDVDRYVKLGAEEDLLRAEASRSPGLIRRLVIENLKSLGGRAEVDLAPITLIYGPNSAGKTTVIQSLLLLKQSLQSESAAGGAQLVTQGDAVDMGSFAGLIHAHDDTLELRIGLEFEPTEAAGVVPLGLSRYVEVAFADAAPKPQQTAATLGFGPEVRLPFGCSSQHPSVDIDGGGRRLFLYLGARERLLELLAQSFFLASQSRGTTGERRLPRSVMQAPTSQRRRHDLSVFRSWLELSDEQLLVFWGDGFFPETFAEVEEETPDAVRPSSQDQRDLQRSLRSVGDDLERLWRAPAIELRLMMEELTHLGPLRAAPARFHDLSGSGDGAVGSRGENLAAHLYWNSRIGEEANEWLARLLVPYEVRVTAVGSAEDGRAIGDVIAMILRDRRSGYDVSPKDVGFGISQLLPIVVHLLTARQSVTCVEQPEIHVHPKLQAELAELLIESTSEERGNQVIVETHSEHLMLRLQRRIREGVLDPERVSVVYVDSQEDGSARVQRLRLDERGQFLDPWPQGFFDERLDEIFGASE